MTMTTTTTQSDCLQRSQKPCPTDVSNGVMTPVKRICRTVYCPAQRTELETSCYVRWHCLKSKKKIYTGLCCTKFCELKETEQILGCWSTVHPLRDQSPCFTFILSTCNSLASTGIKHGIVQRQEPVERLDVRAHGVRWHLLWVDRADAQEGQYGSSFWAQRATDSLSKAPSGNTLWISSSLFDCLVPLMRGTKPPTQKSSKAALREGAAYHIQKLAWLRAHGGVYATVQTLSPARNTRALEAGTPLFSR